MESLGALLVIIGGVGTWYFIKKSKDDKKRNISIGLIVLGVLVVGIFGKTDSSNSAAKETKQTEQTIESSSKEKVVELDVYEPDYILENGSFKLSGTADASKKVKITQGGNTVKEISPTATNAFEAIIALPETDSTEYEITDGDTTEKVMVKSKTTLQKEKDEADAKAKAEQEAAEKKAAEEAKAISDADAKAKAEAEEAAKKAAEEKQKQEAINKASREQINALSKAEDYLSMTAFSKSGLYDQLIFEQFPADAAQFAVDNIVTDWNKQALKKAEDYLKMSSFSDGSLHDQLIFEGFTEEQVQYAMNNLPK